MQKTLYNYYFVTDDINLTNDDICLIMIIYYE